MSPTPRTAALLGLASALALVAPAWTALVAVLLVVLFAAVDAAQVRAPLRAERDVPPVISRGIPCALTVELAGAGRIAGAVRVRQPATEALRLATDEHDDGLRTVLTGVQRGRHTLPAPVVRRTGPLGLARWDHRAGSPADVSVYPDIVGARHSVEAMRKGAFAAAGLRPRGPLGLGTEFESVREYSPDDDLRQVNWLATARAGRPMSNQYRVEQDREVECLVDCGRLMAAPVGAVSRLDAALDAVAAVALATAEAGDRCGLIAFDAEVRRAVAPRRKSATAVVRACFDLEARPIESDYEQAFRTVTGAKRRLIFVFTDLLDEAAARALVDAVPVLARRHAVAVVSARDPDFDALLTRPPASPVDVYEAAVAVELLEARSRAAAALGAAGAAFVEAPPGRLGHECVRAYLKLKSRARL